MIHQFMMSRYNSRGDDRHANSFRVEFRATRRHQENRGTQEGRRTIRFAKRRPQDFNENPGQGICEEGGRGEEACRQGARQGSGQDTREEGQGGGGNRREETCHEGRSRKGGC